MTPEETRAYDRARYRHNREKVLAKRRERYHADLETSRQKNKERYEKYRPSILAKQNARNKDPEVRARRNAYFSRHRNLQVYGTETPVEGQRSLDGKTIYRNFGNRITHPKTRKTWRSSARPASLKTGRSSAQKPQPPRATLKKANSAAGSPATSRNTPTRRGTAAPVTQLHSTSSTASTTPKTPWIPKPETGYIAPPKRPTTYLCSAGHSFPTKRQANACSHRHEKAA